METHFPAHTNPTPVASSLGYVLDPAERQLLTSDPPPGDLLSLRAVVCPFGNDALP